MKNLFLLLPTLAITCCSNQEKVHIIEDYSEVETLISWNEIFNYDDEYLVYFYSENCAHCKEIKNKVLEYYSYHIEPMYFVCTDEYAVFKNGDDLIGIDNSDDLYIFGTPFLIRIYNQVVVSYHAGSSKIVDYIDMKMQK